MAVFDKMATVDLAKLNDSELVLDTSMMYRHEDYVDAYEFIDNNREIALKVLINVDPSEE